MVNLHLLSAEAQALHYTLTTFFSGTILLLLAVGILVEYFKWPLGGVPSFSLLIGRALIASLMLHTFPEVLNATADLTDALSKRLGDFNVIWLVLTRMWLKMSSLTFSWMAIKDIPLWALSFFSLFLLHLSAWITSALVAYAWTLIYIFSPVLIALFVLPATSSATKALYRSLFEVSCWKLVWAVIGTLAWSTVLSDMNADQSNLNFISVVCYNLFLAASLLLTPLVVHSLIQGGISGLARTVQGAALGAAAMNVGRSWGALSATSKRVFNSSISGGRRLPQKYFPTFKKAAEKAPRFVVPKRPSLFDQSKTGKTGTR